MVVCLESGGVSPLLYYYYTIQGVWKPPLCQFEDWLSGGRALRMLLSADFRISAERFIKASDEGEVMSLIPDSTNSLDWSVGDCAMI